MDEFEFLLEDRIAKIQSVNEQYDLENNSYIAFSGGKDSTVLHYLIDLALPGNKIPRVYSNTRIEYNMVVKFVKSIADEDERFVILNQKRNIKQTLEKYGYPFKSKVFSFNLDLYQRLGLTRGVKAFLRLAPSKTGKMKTGQMACPEKLKYCFTDSFKLKVSSHCCDYLKKDLSKQWMKENNKNRAITGLRKEEGGGRLNAVCISENRFNPLIVCSEEWENWFIDKYNIKLCELYYPPYNFKRTGCKGCPYDLNLQQDLNTMAMLLSNERKQCEILWKPVYDEYRRIGYRLDKNYNLFDYLEE